MTRIAAIDVGSNSVRSIIVDVAKSGRFRVLDDEREQTRLSRGLVATGELDDSAMDETASCISRMVEIAHGFKAEHITIVATAAVRTARNGAAFAARVKQATGLTLDVISDDEEARLAWLSAAANFDVSGRVGVLDIGGGSLELCRAVDGTVESLVSLPLGAVVLSERFSTTDRVDSANFKAMKKHIRSCLEQGLGAHPDAVATLIASGGTVTAIASMLSRGERIGASLQAFEVRRADLVHLLAEIRRMSAEERARVPGMPPHRVDVIVAGTTVVSEAMRTFGANVLRVNTKGLREGIVLDTISRLQSTAPRTTDRRRATVEFARRCGYERAHSERVRDLALSLFDQLAAPLGLEPDTRPLLEAAAIMHDVGYHIAYEKHHKHSYHLIVHSGLPGFSARELAMIGAIARYHTGTLPKRKHDTLAALSRDEQDLVIELAALLRLADGIDRTRSQRVEEVRAQLTPHGTVLTLIGNGDLTFEVHGTRKKGDLFTEAFLMPLEIRTEMRAPVAPQGS